MKKKDVIRQTTDWVRQRQSGEGTGHDFWHTRRVAITALAICKKERGDPYVVELSALLHDVADWKFHGGDIGVGPNLARSWLTKLKVESGVVEKVAEIVKRISYKGAGVKDDMPLLEGRIVQDADRLDALGAIGIARTFAYGGSRGRPLYDPDVKPVLHGSFKAYQKSVAPTINHFYEKLLLLKGRMNTRTAKKMAIKRHRFMESYLREFFLEWHGKQPK